MSGIKPNSALAGLWKRGDLEPLLFHGGQAKIDAVYRAAPGSLVVFNISRQWGKTFFGVTKAVVQAIKKPGSRIRIGAAFETDLAEFIEPAFETVLATCPPQLAPKYLQQKRRYVFPNGKRELQDPFKGGSNIKLVGLDRKPNGLRGNTIDLIILDEAGFINDLERLHKSVIVPLTTQRPDAKILLTSTPPESPDHEFWNFVDRAKLENSYAEFTIDENPLLGPADVARLEKEMGGRHTTAFQREYLCRKIVEKERAIIPDFDPTPGGRHVVETPRPPTFPHLHKYEFLDSGVSDLTFEIFAYYDWPRAKLVVEDEHVLHGSAVTTRNIATGTRQKEKDLEYKKVYRRIADNDNLILINDLADWICNPGEEKIHFTPTDKDSLEAMLNELRLWFQDDRIEIHPRCKMLIGTLGSALWNKKRTDFERSPVYGHADGIAALMYGVRNVDRHTNPIPTWFNYNPAAQFRRDKQRSQSATALANALTPRRR
jgi:hypothetical protein